MDIVFISGVHGVGKSTICRDISNKFDIDFFIASDIIKKYKSFITNKKNINFKNMVDNQKILLYGLKKYINKSKLNIVDGHLTLISEEQQVILIPKFVFKEMAPKKIITLIDQPQSIQKRLMHRDNTRYDIDFIQKMQDQEVLYAEKISTELNIALDVININNLELIYSSIKDMINKE